MLTRGDGVIVGLSGGADSVVLLSVLKSLKKEMGLRIFAVHINHNLRNTAMRDEKFVRHLCEEADIPLCVYNADVKGLANAEKLSTEEAGRKLRYQYLHQELTKQNAQKIAMGHHACDNAETVLLNLFRGAGLKGLCGIPPVNGNVIRPLIEASRKAVETYAHENNLRFITDETNLESDYSRNYIRNKIIPVIAEHFGDGATATMARNAIEMRADEEYLSNAAAEALDALVSGISRQENSADSAHCSLPINALLSHPPAISTRIIRNAIATLRGNSALKDIQSSHIHSILDIAQGQSGRQASLPGFTARREYTSLILQITDKIPPALTCESDNLLLSSNTPVKFQSQQITLTLQPPTEYQPGCTKAFNYDNVNNALEIRTRRPGDKITLEGVGTKKLQDYFSDTKTPKAIRDRIPLLADGSNILWILDQYNRTNSAYKPTGGHTTCWVTAEKEGIY